MLSIIFNPVEALQKAKSEHSLQRSLMLALVNSLICSLIAFALTFLSQSVSKDFFSNVLLPTVIIFIVLFLSQLFSGFVIKLIVNTLGGKGDYFAGLTSVTFPFFIIVVTFVAALLVLMLVNFITNSASISALILFAVLLFPICIIGLSLAFSIYYRAIVELFDTDMITSFVGTYILMTVSTIYLLAITYIMGIILTTQVFRYASAFK